MVDGSSNPHGGLAIRVLVVAGCVLLAAAVAVRTIAPASSTAPEDVVEGDPRIAEPMQLLSRGAGLRAGELDDWVSEDRRDAFRATREILFSLEGCPPLLGWIDGADGQSTERLLAELRSGTREDALAALVLIFQLARACEWSPGILARTQHAERLGGLLQDWLRTCGETAARDPLLSEPALAATLLYGRVMRTAWKAPLLSKNHPPFERAMSFLSGLTGIQSGRRTRFGEALASRYARAAEQLVSTSDALLGLEEEAAILFPDLEGDCE